MPLFVLSGVVLITISLVSAWRALLLACRPSPGYDRNFPSRCLSRIAQFFPVRPVCVKTICFPWPPGRRLPDFLLFLPPPPGTLFFPSSWIVTSTPRLPFFGPPRPYGGAGFDATLLSIPLTHSHGAPRVFFLRWMQTYNLFVPSTS